MLQDPAGSVSQGNEREIDKLVSILSIKVHTEAGGNKTGHEYILLDTYGLARLPSGRFTLGLDFVVFIDSIRKLEIKLREREQIEMKVV